jgi:hypothetical protein
MIWMFLFPDLRKLESIAGPAAGDKVEVAN